jgi:hypothetical protein
VRLLAHIGLGMCWSGHAQIVGFLPAVHRMDRMTQLAPLGLQRLRVLACLGGHFRSSSRYFEPAADADICDAFGTFVGHASQEFAADPYWLTIALLAAGRLLTGDLAAADVILDHLPVQTIELDHGAGICLVTPFYALSTVLPWPAELKYSRRWTAGSEAQAALRAWLGGHRDRLVWRRIEGVYLPRAAEGLAARAGAVTRVRYVTTSAQNYWHSVSDLIFVGDVPTLVVEWDAGGQRPAATIPLDPMFLHRIDWEDAQYVYERPVEMPRRPLPRRSIWRRLFG